MTKAHKVDVVENYHGTLVADPYRWLEDPHSPETKAWVKGQNKATRAFIDEFTGREAIRQRLTELWDYPKYLVPRKFGTRYFFQKNDGLQNQAVLYMQESLNGEPVLVLDPNKLSDDGTVAMTDFFIAKDASTMAYSVAESGSDWQQIRIRDINSGLDHADVIRWCKFTNVAWTPDCKGFFYTRFPNPITVSPEEQSYNSKVYYHRLGTDQSEDQLVYERPDFKQLGFHARITEDEKYLVLSVWHGTDPENRVYYRELASEGPFVRLLDDADASYDFVGNVGEHFYFLTDYQAPKGRVVSIDVTNPERENWQEVIPEQADVLASVSAIGGHLVTIYMHHAHHVVQLFTLAGNWACALDLPGIGSVNGLSGKQNDKEMFLSFTSYLYPATLFRYDFTTHELVLFRQAEFRFTPEGYETTQIFFASKDGTQVPLFINFKKGLKLNSDNPTILYGYGGFNISMTPAFSPTQIAWMEMGGVYAVACMRGGSEYGEDWHRAGMLENKQNVFDDFIAAAEWLIANDYTSNKKLSIMGGSNGGLLVAACMVQRPDLYGAVICRVPVIDMLRYHKFTVGRYWVGEYGNAEATPEQFKFMFAYSPLHNVKPRVEYPATLIMTADTDDRVVPAHAMKFAATLQEVYTGPNPIITRVEMKAGHGAGKPTSKLIDETTDIYSFLLKVFGE